MPSPSPKPTTRFIRPTAHGALRFRPVAYRQPMSTIPEPLRLALAGRYTIEPELGAGGMEMLGLKGESQRLLVMHDWGEEVRAKLKAGGTQ